MAIFVTQSPAAGETGLNWSTGQSTAETYSRLAAAIGTNGFLGPNDKLVFRGKYNYAGSLQTSRSDLTIEGGGGANKGLHITDPTATNAATGGASLRLSGSRVHFSDFTITSEPGFNQNRAIFEVRGPDFIFEWGKIDADMKNMFTLEHSAHRPIIRRSELSNVSGYNAGRSVNDFAVSVVGMVGAINDGVYEFNYVHHMPHEHFKTVKSGGGVGASMWRIDDNFATDIRRDFVDSTGGLRGIGPTNRCSISRNTLIRVGQSLIDAKFPAKQVTDFPAGTAHTKYVLIDSNDCYSVGALITTSLEDQNELCTLTAGDRYWRDAISEDILLSNNSVQGTVNQLVYVKTALNIRLSNTRKYGSNAAVKINTQAEMENWTSAGVAAAIYNAGVPVYTETGSTSGAARSVPSAPSFSYGPRSGTAEPSTDPLYVLSGSSFRTNTDLGASSSDIMFGVHNANGADSDTATITVS